MRLALLLGWCLACKGGVEGSGPPESSVPDTGVSTGTTTTTSTTPDPTDSGTTLAPMTDFWIAPDDPELRYVGRWNFEDPLAPWAAWQGSSVVLSFEGTDLSVTLDAGATREWFRVIVDGDSAGSVKFQVDNVMASYPLATGLPQGPHTVELVKESYQGTNATLHGFDITGVGEALLAAPEAPPRRIEFYGDSNLAGYSLESERDQGGTELTGSYFGYAGIASRMLDADYHNISASGETIGSLHNKYDRMDWWSADPAWDFARFTPDVVVVNLGANDVGWPQHLIEADYHDLLDDLRAQHPAAHIVLFNAWGWDYDEPANYTMDVVAARNDPNLSVATFPWVFEQWHGCETDHAGMAAVLADHLGSVMGWVPGPSDVVSGYGVGGDVANGSFEASAPFGGYGWRYFTDPLVTRVEDATEAHDGDFYLSLADGAEVHQPNPATDGQTVTVKVWLRGATGGEEAILTLDFRDQQMWTAPLQSLQQREVLTADWAEYSISATAQPQARPVFHTRITIASPPGDGIDVDAVSMTTL